MNETEMQALKVRLEIERLKMRIEINKMEIEGLEIERQEIEKLEKELQASYAKYVKKRDRRITQLHVVWIFWSIGWWCLFVQKEGWINIATAIAHMAIAAYGINELFQHVMKDARTDLAAMFDELLKYKIREHKGRKKMLFAKILIYTITIALVFFGVAGTIITGLIIYYCGLTFGNGLTLTLLFFCFAWHFERLRKMIKEDIKCAKKKDLPM
jgi:hypothetical protein